MTMSFRYTSFMRNHPVVPLGGRFSRPRPIISVTLIGPRHSAALDALLDTGADDTMFPDSVARSLGIDLSSADFGTAQGVGGSKIAVRYVTLTLRIADNNEQREWPAVVAFAPLPNQLPLLGFAGFLQYFTACFHGDLEYVELTVNALYPGT
jgi:predicted aspartyl protease